MGAVTEVTDQEFETQILKADKPVLVDFWADWCVPCHMVSPVVEEIGIDKAADMKVAKLNVDDNPSTAQRYGVMSIPTLLVFKGGEVVETLVGNQSKGAIQNKLQPHLG